MTELSPKYNPAEVEAGAIKNGLMQMFSSHQETKKQNRILS
ncbi:Uncharacterised protein [Streptococcus pyogenes]|nr:Uncharacterised protein [Streptococcus pyogenes]